ncbi:MAG: transcription termination/antitermination NusG family protein [Tepidisphaeraceae bacterium]
MLSLAENPTMLPQGVSTLTDLKGQWWVAHTKARAEKAFAWDLASRGVAYFLPMLERVRFSGGRKRHLLMPMFSSYVFFCGDRDARYQALTTNRLCQVIEVTEQTRFVDELHGIERALFGNAELEIYPHATLGKRCRFISGPFVGVEGVVVQRGELNRVVLQISVLGQGVSLNVHPDMLVAIDE